MVLKARKSGVCEKSSLRIDYDILIDLANRAYEWTLSYCDALEKNNLQNVRGFVLRDFQFRVLGIDAQMIGGELAYKGYAPRVEGYHFWVEAVDSFWLELSERVYLHYKPHQLVGKCATIKAICFKPDPRLIPSFLIDRAICRMAKKLGLNEEKLFFKYNGITIRSAEELASYVITQNDAMSEEMIN